MIASKVFIRLYCPTSSSLQAALFLPQLTDSHCQCWNSWCISPTWRGSEGARRNEIYCCVFFIVINFVEKHKCIICLLMKISCLIYLERYMVRKDYGDPGSETFLSLFLRRAGQFPPTTWMAIIPFIHLPCFFLLRHSDPAL